VEEEEDEQEKEESMMMATPPQPAGLSKSWAVRSAHVPIYTGGTMALLKMMDDKNTAAAPILCTMVNGDVCLSTITGVKHCSLRGKGDTIGDGDHNGEDKNEAAEEEEDDEGYDVDSVTCFVVLSASARILTCSFNSVIRQYTILSRQDSDNGSSGGALLSSSSSSSSSSNKKTKKYQARLDGVLGKSGHALPVTTMVAHGAFLATGSVDGSVRVFDTRQAQLAPTHVFRYNNAKVTSVAWYPGSRQDLIIGIGREDGSIAIHNLFGASSSSSAHPHHQQRHKTTRKAAAAQRDDVPVALLKDHDSAVTSLVWDVDRQLFYTAGRDSVIIVWKIIIVGNESQQPTTIKYQKVHTVPVYERVEGMQLIYYVAAAADNNNGQQQQQRTMLVSGGSKGILRLWETGDDDRLIARTKQSEKDWFGEARGGYLALVRHDYDRGIVLVADAEHNVSLVTIVAGTPDGNDNDK
jgi:WD40 repeat protein